MKASSALAVLAFAVTLSSPVYAQHGHGGGHGGGWGLGGLVVGAAIFGLAAQSAYQSSYAYSYPYQNPDPYPYESPMPIYVQPTYVQAPQQAMAVPAMASWYFCRDSQAYYPYVQSCAAGWERVPATPPGQ